MSETEVKREKWCKDFIRGKDGKPKPRAGDPNAKPEEPRIRRGRWVYDPGVKKGEGVACHALKRRMLPRVCLAHLIHSCLLAMRGERRRWLRACPDCLTGVKVAALFGWAPPPLRVDAPEMQAGSWLAWCQKTSGPGGGRGVSESWETPSGTDVGAFTQENAPPAELFFDPSTTGGVINAAIDR